VAVRHCHLVTFVRHCTFKPSFFSPLFLSPVSSPAHCLNSPGDILCCNLKTRGQEIKCKRISLKPIGGLVQNLLLFSNPILPSHSVLSSPSTSIVFLEEFICCVFAFSDTRQGHDVSPFSGQFLYPFVNETLRECLSADGRNWRVS